MHTDTLTPVPSSPKLRPVTSMQMDHQHQEVYSYTSIRCIPKPLHAQQGLWAYGPTGDIIQYINHNIASTLCLACLGNEALIVQNPRHRESLP